MRQLPLSLGEAIAVLREAAQDSRFLALYRHFFPQGFAASKASLRRAPGQAYSEREVEFFELVNYHLFPIPALTDYILVDWDAEERSPYIPITPWGRDWWDEYDLEPGWQVLLFLAGEFSFSDPPHYSLTLAGHADWPQLRELIRQALEAGALLAELERAAAQAPEPLRYLPLALQVVRHDVENVWIDTTPETPFEDVLWCIENIDYLASECKRAEKIMDQVTGLVSWLEEDLVGHLRKAVELWQQSLVRA